MDSGSGGGRGGQPRVGRPRRRKNEHRANGALKHHPQWLRGHGGNLEAGNRQRTLLAVPNIPAYSFAKNDGFSLNAVDLALDKPEDESPWAAGYHVELMLGSDRANRSKFLWLWRDGLFRQAYVTLRTPVGNGIDWKVGVFDTIIGYESTSDPLDPNYTRSYGYTIEPTTHTGVLATYKINDMVTVSAGIAEYMESDTIAL